MWNKHVHPLIAQRKGYIFVYHNIFLRYIEESTINFIFLIEESHLKVHYKQNKTFSRCQNSFKFSINIITFFVADV